MSDETGRLGENEQIQRVLYEHREGALTCYDHPPSPESPWWCCPCGEHEIKTTWRAHVAERIDAILAARLAPVLAILHAWEAWDGSPGPDGRTHPDSSSPRDRKRLRAALFAPESTSVGDVR